MTRETICKSLTTFGITWYKAREKNSRINIFLENTDEYKNGGIMIKIWHPKRGQYWGVATPDQIRQVIECNRYCYEIIPPSKKRKVYFDIDLSPNSQHNLDQIKDIISHQFPHALLNISGYENETKRSYHIILQNYHFDNTDDTKRFVLPFCKAHREYGFDDAVYNNFAVFKCINQSKPNYEAPIQAFIEGDAELSKHLTLIEFDDNSIDASTLDWNAYAIQPKTISLKEQLTDIVNFSPDPMFLKEIPDTFSLANSSAIDKLKLLPNPPKISADNYLKHNEIWKIMVWSKNEGITFDVFWKWNSQKCDSQERMVKYYHLWNNTGTYKINESFIDALLITVYPELQKDIHKRRFKKINTIHHSLKVDSQFLSSTNVTDVKYSFLDVRMGGNKTGSVSDFILNAKYKRVLFIVPRIALAYDLLNRFPDFTVYKDVKDKTTLKQHDKLIVSIQSLHHLTDVSYDCIILDEVETTFSSFKGDASTHKTPKSNHVFSNWSMFLAFLRKAHKVFIMDAFLTTTTIEMLKLNDPDATHEIIGLTVKPDKRYFVSCDSQSTWLQQIETSIEKGEKVCIFLPYKFTKPQDLHFGIQELTKYLANKYQWQIGKDIIEYYAEKTEEKKRLKDVDTVWAEAKCIISNTCISVGVNYQGKDFDRVFCYFVSWIDTNDFCQFLYRVRFPKNNEMVIYCERQKPMDTYIKPSPITSCKVWDLLQRKFNIVANASARTKLNILAKRANIITKPSDKPVEESVDESIVNVLDPSQFRIKWDDIPDITDDEYEMLVSDLETEHNCIIDSLKLKKHILKHKFKPDTPKDVLCSFFLNQTLEALEGIVSDRKNVINEIFTYNNVNPFDALASQHLVDMKIPDVMTNSFLKTHFKFHHPVSKRGRYLLQRIFNAYFNCEVVYSKREDDNHTKYHITPSFIQLVEHYKQYSVKYNSINAYNQCMFIEEEVEDAYEICKDKPPHVLEAYLTGKPFTYDRKTGNITFD